MMTRKLAVFLSVLFVTFGPVSIADVQYPEGSTHEDCRSLNYAIQMLSQAVESGASESEVLELLDQGPVGTPGEAQVMDDIGYVVSLMYSTNRGSIELGHYMQEICMERISD